ncbi:MULTISPECIES: hypothetical protein [Achromobacter]|uniref:hypothetical protein n=1 Tax=Achromobacter TaxID=222 RepID=UPI0023F8500E|nr:hypothetical protein [Achromobacter anxifer]MDF8363369.1 hypothetical protein [Achromobacter anxifer]
MSELRHESAASHQGPRNVTSGHSPDSIRNAALDDVIHLICRSFDLKLDADVGPELLRRIERLRPPSGGAPSGETAKPSTPPPVDARASFEQILRRLDCPLELALDGSSYMDPGVNAAWGCFKQILTRWATRVGSSGPSPDNLRLGSFGGVYVWVGEQDHCLRLTASEAERGDIEQQLANMAALSVQTCARLFSLHGIDSSPAFP